MCKIASVYRGIVVNLTRSIFFSFGSGVGGNCNCGIQLHFCMGMVE